MYRQGLITSLVGILDKSGANFARSVVDNLNIRPEWAEKDDDFMTYFILFFYILCFLGSLPSKITALRYFTFITAVINLYLGVVD